MSYRTFKKVVGETNLERKCRLLVGVCMAALISVSFLIYGGQTRKIIDEKSQDTGRLLVDVFMIRFHWIIWETMGLDQKTSVGLDQKAREDRKRFLSDVSQKIPNLEYQAKMLALEPPADRLGRASDVQRPENAEEARILEQLRQDLEKRLSQSAAGRDGAEHDPEEWIVSRSFRVDRNGGEYHYYQAVVWKESCATYCHVSRKLAGSLSMSESGLTLSAAIPFRAVKVVIPDGPTQRAIAYNNAILWATAILTAFLAVVFLYVIVRYVIVKPLSHLREVSEEIVHGNLDARAEIHTNDDFEDLAESFNKMVRHLLDTQQELRTVNSHLDAKVDELAQVNIKLYEMNRLKSEFLTSMTHELRTPLNSILGFSDLLKGIDTLTSKQQRHVENIHKSGRWLLERINDILDLAKLEAGKMQVRPVEFRVGGVVSAQCEAVRSLAEKKNIDVEVQIEPDLPPMIQDQSKVQQILNNLLSNAIKFTPEGGRIVVSARRTEAGQLEMTVTDTGVGIAQEDREIIFEKFRQGSVTHSDNLTREYSGTGLGLSIIKELCKLLGGEITFESELGKGSAFTVTLPWTRAEGPRRDSLLAAKLDELTKPRRVDFQEPFEPAPPHVGAASPQG